MTRIMSYPALIPALIAKLAVPIGDERLAIFSVTVSFAGPSTWITVSRLRPALLRRHGLSRRTQIDFNKFEELNNLEHLLTWSRLNLPRLFVCRLHLVPNYNCTRHFDTPCLT